MERFGDGHALQNVIDGHAPDGGSGLPKDPYLYS